MIKLTDILKQIIQEKEDRCKRIADRKYDKPSAYKSGAIVRCRKGNIWKDLKEEISLSQTRIVDNEGNPLVVYRSQKDERQQGATRQSNQKGIYFSANEESTKIYGNITKKYYLNIKNPLVLKDKEWNLSLLPGYYYNLLIDKGYDGAVWLRNGEMYEIIAFYPEQIIPIVDIKEADDPQAGKAAPYGSGYAKVKQAVQEQLDQLDEKQKETLRTWFKRKGAPGKEGGWVDCNAPIRKDGKITGYKTCGRKEGEERSKYPSCRPTPAACKDKGKGKTWGKTK
jgi:hypothetical protein